MLSTGLSADVEFHSVPSTPCFWRMCRSLLASFLPETVLLIQSHRLNWPGLIICSSAVIAFFGKVRKSSSLICEFNSPISIIMELFDTFASAESLLISNLKLGNAEILTSANHEQSEILWLKKIKV